MDIFDSVKTMQAKAASLRNQGKTVAFVPTMGYFHEGHLNLMREGRKRADYLVVSIYVNPTQFSPTEDLDQYPRDFTRDCSLAEQVGVDAVFFPDNAAMYPQGYQTYIDVENVTRNLCGASRPGHFRGVATICAKLFHIVQPHVTIFGKKDFQQLAVIKTMLRDLNMDIELIGLATTREDDGLAMSSRNAYLSAEERKSALALSRSLALAKHLFESGETDGDTIVRQVTQYIESHPLTNIDYVQISNADTIEETKNVDRNTFIALAVKVGATRLIDNYVFGDALDVPRPE
ncbi:MAG: pantoate--beta-alanine ligase [Syntrophobacterales bacterium]|nr:pantoate--beta-alanine ligase [Syntrophobacterales bacterium]